MLGWDAKRAGFARVFTDEGEICGDFCVRPSYMDFFWMNSIL